MNTKIISRALLALTLFTPLGVLAAGENNTQESCLATFSVSDQTLTIPCVEVVMGNETVLYSAQLQQVEEGSFALTQVAELSAAVESECVASYSLESGRLVVPCLDGFYPNFQKNSHGLVLLALKPVSPNTLFVIGESESLTPKTRSRHNQPYDGNWDVPFLDQTTYAKNMAESACGPTSVTMLLRFYYPNSNIDMPEVYHAGTQSYRYDSGPANGYGNVSFATGGKTGADWALTKTPQQYRQYYIGTYSGMELTDMQTYLQNIWAIRTQILDENGVYAAIGNGPLLGRVYGHGNTQWPHYLVIRGIAGGNNPNDRRDDTIYVNDPYGSWNSAWDTGGNNKAISYDEFFLGIGARHGSPWFRSAIQLTPQDTPDQREYTVVVDTGHNTFGSGSPGYHKGYHKFEIDDPVGSSNGTPNWKFYYGSGGDWYYPAVSDSRRAARWTPTLMQKGYYQVSVKFRGDNSSGNVTYTIYSKDGVALSSMVVNQYRSTSQWTFAVIADSILLENGAYVRASNIPVGTNADAVKFKFLNRENLNTGGNYFWTGNGSIISYHRQRANTSDDEYPHGIEKDLTTLHPGSPVAFFQWQVTKGSCDRLSIFAKSPNDVKRADITVGSWDSRSSDRLFENVSLPFVIGEGNTGIAFPDAGWYVVSVAFKDAVTQFSSLYAECTSQSPSYQQSVAGKPVLLNGGYKWNGNASIISRLFSHLYGQNGQNFGGEWPFGVFHDVTKVSPSPEKPVVFFQWMASDMCTSLTIDSPDLGYSEKQVKISSKQWSSSSYDTQSGTLPMTLYNSNVNSPWRVIQVAFESPVSKTASVTAKCPGDF